MQRKYEFQDGGSQPGNTYIPAYNTYITTCKLQNSNGNSPRWINSVKLFPILCKASRSQKCKMAAHKYGKLICHLVYNVAGQFQRLQTCIFGLKNSAKRFPILCNASKRTYILACIQFQQLYPYFQGIEMQRNYSVSCVMQAECRMQAAILDF